MSNTIRYIEWAGNGLDIYQNVYDYALALAMHNGQRPRCRVDREMKCVELLRVSADGFKSVLHRVYEWDFEDKLPGIPNPLEAEDGWMLGDELEEPMLNDWVQDRIHVDDYRYLADAVLDHGVCETYDPNVLADNEAQGRRPQNWGLLEARHVAENLGDVSQIYSIWEDDDRSETAQELVRVDYNNGDSDAILTSIGQPIILSWDDARLEDWWPIN